MFTMARSLCEAPEDTLSGRMHSFFQHRGTALLLAGLIGACCGLSRGDESRVFTNKDGKTIEAELVAVNGSRAEIRRAADGQIFQLEIVNLSLDDQAWIADWLRGGSGDWMNLRVTLPGVIDYLGVIGTNGSMTIERVGEREFDLYLPRGAWVEINVNPPTRNGGVYEHLLRYEGEAEWEVSCEGPAVLLSRDGAPPRIAGLTLPEGVAGSPDGLADFVGGLDPSRFDDSLSVEIPNRFDPGDFAGFGRPVAAITADAPLTGEALAKVQSWKPRALSLAYGDGCFDVLESFESLEALELRSEATRMVDGVRVPLLEKPSFRLPSVRDLSLISVPFIPELGESLATTPGLRLLFQSSPSRRRDGPPPPVEAWDDLAGFAALESIHVGFDVRMSAEELAALPRLRSLALNGRNLDWKDPSLAKLADLRGLLQLAIGTSSFDREIQVRWAENGGLGDLRHLRSFQSDGLDRMPRLQRLSIFRAPDSPEELSPDAFAGLPDLRCLALTNLAQREVDLLASLPSAGKLETLRFFSGKFESLASLESLSGLRRIELISWNESPEILDFNALPRLEMIHLSRLGNLRAVHDLSAHPTLRSFQAYGCDKLADFGRAAENSTLRQLVLQDCAAIPNLAGFAATKGLKEVRIYNCDALAEPVLIDQLNPGARIYIGNCALLKDRR